MTHMEFQHDIQAHIFVSWLHPFKDQPLVVVGDEAMAVFNDVADGPDKVLLYPHRAGWDGEIPVLTNAQEEPIPYDVEAEPLRCECEAFLSAVRGNGGILSDAEEGLRVLQVLDASARSLATNLPVSLDVQKPAA